MRRLALLTLLVIALAACSDSEPMADEASVESTAAPSTTTQVTTTTVAESATTTQAVPTEFDTTSGTPPHEFDSFTGTMSMTFELDDVEITVNSVGTWTEDAFECTISSEFGGLTFSESIIATPAMLWYDQGNGFEEADLFTGSAADLLGSCPASPLFWADFTTDEMGNLSGEIADYNGRSAFQANLTDLFDAMAGLGVTGVDEDMVQTMEVWIDEETNTIIGLYTEINMPSELLDGVGAEGETQLSMEFSLDNFDDPTLSIELP